MPDRNDRFSKDEYEDWPTEQDRRWRDDKSYQRVRYEAQEAIRRAGGDGRRRRRGKGLRAIPKPALIVGAIVIVAAILALATYFIFSRTTATKPGAAPQSPPVATAPAANPQTPPPSDSQLPGITSAPPNTAPADDNFVSLAARITLRLALAALLTSLLAFRPRKDLPVMQRNPYVAQTQILLAVVASALMMVVADNAARAFGIFAAASLVRFRTNIRDPKEITVLLVCLGVGLATGVGKIELAVISSLFVLVMLWVLEYYEPAQVYRALELTVMTRHVDETDELLREIFDRYQMNYELRIIDREDEADPMGKIVYHVNVTPRISTDKLSEEIFASDPEHIDSVAWDQKKSQSYIYR
ncbi:MAG TPA: DUF4956 domain-containing protein [Blastocatellia bacterium]|nr:DUF4956 domain-containing protein [Blastocatellia bacterium]